MTPIPKHGRCMALCLKKPEARLSDWKVLAMQLEGQLLALKAKHRRSKTRLVKRFP